MLDIANTFGTYKSRLKIELFTTPRTGHTALPVHNYNVTIMLYQMIFRLD